MNLWLWILAACAIAYVTKLVGYLLPASWLENPWVSTLSHGVTVGLLASLVAVNTFVSGTSIVLDARVVALGAAAVALLVRAPYLVVVVVGAAAAALARLAGMA
ncbi:branched-chain amino acid transporter AzlD [Sorangium cellulosum]|nr:branched-chain amino acid transporter AzlD [Sorangium cellulosum]